MEEVGGGDQRDDDASSSSSEPLLSSASQFSVSQRRMNDRRTNQDSLPESHLLGEVQMDEASGEIRDVMITGPSVRHRSRSRLRSPAEEIDRDGVQTPSLANRQQRRGGQ